MGVPVDRKTAELIRLFENPLCRGLFNNSRKEYLDSAYRKSVYPTFYSKTYEERGYDAAEATLTTVGDERVANAVAEIVTAIVNVAYTGNTDARLIRFEKIGSLFPFSLGTSDQTFGVVLYNPGLLGYSRPASAHKFAPDGELGITAFVVVIDPVNPDQNAVILTLRLRGCASSDGFVTVELNRNGRMTSGRCEVVLCQDAALNLAIGIGPTASRSAQFSGGAPGQYVGFPGAQDYITSNLGELVDYLEDVAPLLDSAT